MKAGKTFLSIGIAGVVVVGLSACNNPPTPKVGQNVNNVNQLQDQEQVQTVDGFNTALKNLESQYPAKLMANSLELKMLKERDLFMNDSNKLQYIYIFPSGRSEVLFSSVRGKVSALNSQMTATDGVYLDQGTGGGGNVLVPMPQDDLSYGGTEFGNDGIFWFAEQGGFHAAGVAGATVMI